LPVDALVVLLIVLLIVLILLLAHSESVCEVD
jgi:hypothetical protein